MNFLTRSITYYKYSYVNEEVQRFVGDDSRSSHSGPRRVNVLNYPTIFMSDSIVQFIRELPLGSTEIAI